MCYLFSILIKALNSPLHYCLCFAGQYIDYTAAYGSQIAATGLEATYPYVSTAGLVTATTPYTYAVPQQLAAATGHAFYQPQQLQERMQ